MATSATRLRPPNPSTTLALGLLGLKFTEDNSPNPEIFVPSLRMSGYTLETAIGDLVDNPLDKEASTVLVEITKMEDDWMVEVADDGLGMDIATLDQMMRLGSRADHDLAADLGRFGLGSTTASLSLGRQQHVITSYEPGKFASAATDLDEIIRQRRFVKHLGDATQTEQDLFAAAFSRHGLAVPSTGTLVRVLRCDNIGRHHLKPAADSLKRWIGETYRYFIDAGKRFYVNGELVSGYDPLEREKPETTILFDDSFEYQFPKGHQREGQVEKVGVILAQLPDYGGWEANKEHGLSIDRSGLYLLRNRREIAAAITFRFWAQHQELSRFRGELLFPAAMDEDLGVTFLKSAWNVQPTQSLRDKIEQTVMPYVRQARRLYQKTVPNVREEVPHDEAAKVIRQRSPFLRKPQGTIERRSPRAEPGIKVQGKEKAGPSRTQKEPRMQRALADAAEFRVVDLGPTAPVYEATLAGRKIVISYNAAHPFYQRFIVENRDNRGVVAGIDYFVYSLASAELLARDDDTYRFIERMREDMSFNLRQLLTT